MGAAWPANTTQLLHHDETPNCNTNVRCWHGASCCVSLSTWYNSSQLARQLCVIMHMDPFPLHVRYVVSTYSIYPPGLVAFGSLVFLGPCQPCVCYIYFYFCECLLCIAALKLSNEFTQVSAVDNCTWIGFSRFSFVIILISLWIIA